MALCHNCDDSRIEYTSNGFQTDYTFPFEYNKQTDVAVAFYDEIAIAWVKQESDVWSFLNDTTIQLVDPLDTTKKLIIYRCTDLEPLPAEFFPASAIKAQDLNDNFFVLKSAIEESRCEIASLDGLVEDKIEALEDKYWSKLPASAQGKSEEIILNDTITGDDPWVCNDSQIATTQAICDKIAREIGNQTVKEVDQKQGQWIQNDGVLDSDEYTPTAAASTERWDPYFQEILPQQPPYQIPGKVWFDDGEIRYRVWDQEAEVWIDATQAGRRGQPGAPGPIGPTKTIVSETAPQKRDDDTLLRNGDFWFDSSNAQIYVYYNDGNPDDTRGVQWVQALGSGGGGGSSNYNFFAPLKQTGADVQFNINNLNSLNPN